MTLFPPRPRLIHLIDSAAGPSNEAVDAGIRTARANIRALRQAPRDMVASLRSRRDAIYNRLHPGAVLPPGRAVFTRDILNACEGNNEILGSRFDLASQ